MRARRGSPRAGLLLWFVGGVAVAASAALPYLPGWTGYRTPDGNLSMGMGIVIAMFAVIASRSTSRMPVLLGALASGVALVVSGIDLLGANGPGLGVYVAGGGALLALVGAFLSVPRRVRRHAGDGR